MQRDVGKSEGRVTLPSDSPAVDMAKPPEVARGSGVTPQIETAVWLVLGAGLRGEPSPLDPGVVTWTTSNARELRKRVEDEPETGKGSFLTKLQRQLDGASRGVILLAAELLYIQVAPLSNVTASAAVSRP